ncbi:phage tail tape measure protein [Bhargavaea beijingensis]|uniref:phage tail tape measure protein n=1 Tax=Bhargavaea beijingensis TaxID=426756 RepID=UPI0022246766|nr:phage tail tape measure protein [Bhargavaea beijingensis]MCW1926960.1 phage tail tape measure protein [Bhargavaea beijingensis]
MEQNILVKIGADISDFSRNLQKASKGLMEFQQANKETFENFAAVGGAVTAIGTVIATGLGVSVKAASDWESAFAGVRKTVSASESEFAELEKGIRGMSKELPASATEIAGVAEAAGQLGIQTPNILDFTRTMIDLGESTNLSSTEAATALAQFANITQMSQGDFSRLGSSIVSLGNSMATTESSIVDMAMRLAGVGEQVGLSEAEIMALSATMSSLGINAEAGGSAMSMVMKKIQDAVSDGGDELAGFAKAAGMSSTEFAKAWQNDPITALDAFVKGLNESGAEGQNLNGILGDLGIKGINETDTLLRMAGASDLLSTAVNTSTSAWKENSALSNEAAQRYETFASKLEMFKNTLTDLGISIGQVLLPYIASFTEKAQSLVNWFTQLSPTVQKVGVAIAAITAALSLFIGPILMIIGFIPHLVAGFSALTTVGTTLGGMFAVLTGPIGLTVAAIAAAISVMVLMYNKVAWFRDGVNAAWNIIKEVTTIVFSAVQSTISNVISGVVSFVSAQLLKLQAFWAENGQAIMTIVRTAFHNVQAIIQVVMSVIRGVFYSVWPAISAIVRTAVNLIKTVVDTGISLVLGIVQTGMKLLQGDWQGAWNTIKDTAETIMENIIGFFKSIDLVGTGKDIILGLIKGISSMVGGVVSAVKNIGGNIKSAFTSFFDIHSPSRVMANLSRHLGTGIVMGIDSEIHNVKRAADRLTNAAMADITPANMSIGVSGAAFGFNGSLEVDGSSDRDLLERIARAVERDKETSVIMDGHAVGRLTADGVNERNAEAAHARRYFG